MIPIILAAAAGVAFLRRKMRKNPVRRKGSSKRKNRKAFDIPAHVSVYDSAGQLVHSQDGGGYLDTAAKRKNPKRRAKRRNPGKNGYICFYKSKQLEVHADTSYEAQQIAAKHFKAKKSYDVHVVLAEKGGEQVTHTITNPRRRKNPKDNLDPSWMSDMGLAREIISMYKSLSAVNKTQVTDTIHAIYSVHQRDHVEHALRWEQTEELSWEVNRNRSGANRLFKALWNMSKQQIKHNPKRGAAARATHYLHHQYLMAQTGRYAQVWRLLPISKNDHAAVVSGDRRTTSKRQIPGKWFGKLRAF
jgi:hypothetical protein